MHANASYFWFRVILKFHMLTPDSTITVVLHYYIPRRKSGIYWIQVRRAAAAAAVEISLWTR